MPNWCNNSVEIVGPREKIRALWDKANSGDDNQSLLNALYPMPSDISDSEESVMPGWWQWRVDNWGTKWDVGLEGLEYEEDEDGNFDNGTGVPYARITGWFDSAWAPPVGAMSHYGVRNEDVKITLDYNEPGMAFVGRYTIEEGVEDDDYYEYTDATSETVRDIIGEDMDDFWNISEQMSEWEEDEKAMREGEEE